MHFEQPRPDKTEERILPLINVVFLLLIFFMIAGSLSVTDPFDVDPPHSTTDTEIDKQQLRILMSADGQLALNGKRLSETELLQRIQQYVKGNSQHPLQLKADHRIAGNQLVGLLDKLRQSGVDKLILLTLEAHP